MELKIPVKGPERIYLLLNLFSSFKPYNLLNNRERQVFAELLYVDYELRQLDEHRRSRLIFDYDTRREISQKLSISSNSVYNIMSSLKRKNFIKDGMLKNKLDYTDKVVINFIDGKLGENS